MPQFVKVPHHGSDNGANGRQWENLSNRDGHAVVTSFVAHRLPAETVLTSLRQRFGQVHCTDKVYAETRLGLSLAPSKVEQLPRREHLWGAVLLTATAEGRTLLPVRHFGTAGVL